MAAENYIIIAVAVLLLVCGICLRAFKIPRARRLRGLLSVFSFILAFILVLKVILLPEFGSIDTTGEYAYASVTFQMEDASREETYESDGGNRKLSVIVTYPDSGSVAEGSCPLIVFSHGGISYKDSNTSLYRELASHGYIVASIDHPYQSLFTSIDGRKVWIDSGYLKELQTEDANEDIANSFACYQEWMKIRTADISFVIDSFVAEAAKSDNGFYSLIDTSRIAAMGHSLGGAAALGVARQRSDIRAAVALESPYFCDITGYDDSGFTWNTAPYDCAMLNIYSDSGYPLIETDIRYAQNRRYLKNEGSVEYGYIEGSNHYTLTDLALKSPILCALLGGGYSAPGEETLKTINEQCLAFFERYL